MMKVVKYVKRMSKKAVFMAFMLMAMTTQAFATEGPNTGNADLDVILGNMDSGLDTIKTGGLYIISGVILIAIVFFGARWLWNMWRAWMARAQ